MAATLAPRADIAGAFHTNVVPGVYFEDLIEVTGDASYPTGGYPITAALLFAAAGPYGGAYNTLHSVEVVNPWFASATSTTFIAAWNKTTGKLQAFTQAVAGAATAQAEITAATSLTTFTATVRIRFT